MYYYNYNCNYALNIVNQQDSLKCNSSEIGDELTFILKNFLHLNQNNNSLSSSLSFLE